MLCLRRPIVLAGLSLAAALLPSIAPAGAAGHLYASTLAGGAGYPGVIYRFLLKNGIPATKPDLTIPGYCCALAASSDGTLYAQGGAGHRQIFAFPYGSTKAQRSITIPPMFQCDSYYGITIAALAADVQGNLFVGLNGVAPQFDVPKPPTRSRAAPTANRGVTEDWSLCEGVAIFGSTQSGGERPAHEIVLPVGEYVFALAIDDTENLYASLAASMLVQEYANAFSHPHPTRVFPWQPSTTFIGGLATDAGGNVYMLNLYSEVQVFPPSGMQMRNDMTFASPHASVASIAATSQYLYAANSWIRNGSARSVDVYNASASGAQKPLLSLPVTGLQAVAVGP